MFKLTHKKKLVNFVVKEKIDVTSVEQYNSKTSQVLHNVMRAKNMTNLKSIPIFYRFGFDKRYSIAATLFVLAMHKKESLLENMKKPKSILEKEVEEKTSNISKSIDELIKKTEKNIESLFDDEKSKKKRELRFKRIKKIERLHLWKNKRVRKEKKSIMKDTNRIETSICNLENRLRNNVANCVSNLIFKGAVFFFSKIGRISKDDLIIVKNVTKKIITKDSVLHILEDVNLVIKKGEMVAIMGESGSGKTTLLNILSGLDSATSGDVLFSNKNLTYLTDKHLMKFRQKHVSILFQGLNLLNNISAMSNVMVGSSFSTKKIKKKNVLELFEVLGLKGLEKKLPPSLSGGEQQRVAMVRALLKYPDVLFFDEPTASLDKETGQGILDLLKLIQKKYNTTVVIVTHSPSVARQADRIIEIKNGKIVDNKNAKNKSLNHIVYDSIWETKTNNTNMSLYLQKVINLKENDDTLDLLEDVYVKNEGNKYEKI